MNLAPTDGRRRISARELYETTWRALLAAGISAGEAASAARSVRHAEINFGAGLLAVTAELARATDSRQPCQLARGDLDVLNDPVGRGVLLLAPLAIGLVVAPPSPSPALVPGRAWDRVLLGVLATQSVSTGSPLVVVEIDRQGQLGAGAVAEPDAGVCAVDGKLLERTSFDNNVSAAWIGDRQRGAAALAEAGADRGLLFSSAHTRLGAPDVASVKDPALSASMQSIELEGVDVDAAEWHAVYRAAQRFLVAEG